MSGFVALFQRNGAPVDRGLLGGLSSFLSFRGPDARDTWASGPVGMGHTLLRVSRSSVNERQPFTLDGQFSIVTDARLDSRSELRERLLAGGRDVRRVAFDAELILHAYALWGEDCVLHLRGDFSFAIWDARRRTLFCARDHFGIRPFYYAEAEDYFVCSNTLDCVRLHPSVSDGLNDDAVADFLLFGLNCNKSTTTFRDVQRLAPAHTLSVSAAEKSEGRYWSAPVDGRIRYKHNEEYVEHFREVLNAAVADRLDVDRAAIFLSGGMDSGAIAATARQIAAESNRGIDLRAFTVTYEELLDDREGYYAAETARFLGIPIEILAMDDVQPFADEPEFVSPEPLDDPLSAGLSKQYGAVARHSRVVFDGEGIDNLMHFQLRPYLSGLWQHREWATLIGAAAGYLWRKRARWQRLWSRLGRRFASNGNRPSLPQWIAPEFARRLNLIERWEAYGLPAVSPSHPILPQGHASLELPHWSRMFEASAAGFTHELVEVRYPFLDLRIVEFMLALPPSPLLLDKNLERAAMAGKLPQATLRRAKCSLVGDPGAEAMRNGGYDILSEWNWSGRISQYVDVETLFQADERPYSANGTSCTLALCFNFWLQSLQGVRYNLCSEVRNG